MPGQIQQDICCDDVTVRDALERARQALAAAVASMTYDADSACDELVAARLLVDTALLKLEHA